MAIRFKRKTVENWHVMEVNQEAVDKSYRKREGRIMFPTAHDLIPSDPSFSSCMVVLEKLLESGNQVLVTTKPRLEAVKYICNMFEKYLDQVQFRFTITSINDKTLAEWEPGAPLFWERYHALEFAFLSEFKTSVSCEPALDGPADLQVLYDTCAPLCTESFWLGTMNYCRPPVHLDPAALVRQFQRKSKIRFKDSITNQIMNQGHLNITR
jgi:DNA repair photolyase